MGTWIFPEISNFLIFLSNPVSRDGSDKEVDLLYSKVPLLVLIQLFGYIQKRLWGFRLIVAD